MVTKCCTKLDIAIVFGYFVLSTAKVKSCIKLLLLFVCMHNNLFAVIKSIHFNVVEVPPPATVCCRCAAVVIVIRYSDGSGGGDEAKR